VAVACLFSFVVKNMLKMDTQGWFNNASAIFQLVSTTGIIIAIIVAAPARSTSEFVWTNYYSSVGLEGQNNQAYVLIIGMLTTLYGMSGYEAGSEVAEET